MSDNDKSIVTGLKCWALEPEAPALATLYPQDLGKIKTFPVGKRKSDDVRGFRKQCQDLSAGHKRV